MPAVRFERESGPLIFRPPVFDGARGDDDLALLRVTQAVLQLTEVVREVCARLGGDERA